MIQKLYLSAALAVMTLSCAVSQETSGKITSTAIFSVDEQDRYNQSLSLECRASQFLLDRVDSEVLAACTSTTADAAECADSAKIFSITKQVYELDCR